MPRRRNIMTLSYAFALIVTLQVPSFAQNQFVEPVPPLKGPGFTVGVGYEYLAMQGSSSHSIPLNGLNANGVMEFNRRWALTTDLSYVRASNIMGTGQEGYVLNLLAGPELCLKGHRNGWFFVHALGGSALVNSAAPTNDGYLRGWVARPSFGAGGGMEKSLRGPFGIRVYGDYVRTAFANSLATVEPKNNFRSVVSFVFRMPFEGPR
jgi:hypothetical protein